MQSTYSTALADGAVNFYLIFFLSLEVTRSRKDEKFSDGPSREDHFFLSFFFSFFNTVSRWIKDEIIIHVSS